MTRIRLPVRAAALILLGCAAPFLAFAEEDAAVNTGYFGNVAIEGYDPVAYFTERRAVLGSPQHAYEWLGAEWRFANEEHRAMFSRDPVGYAPQYGGLCSDGIAYGGMTVNIDPEAFTIVDGKLYLNADLGAKRELETLPGQIDRARENWPKVRERFLGN